MDFFFFHFFREKETQEQTQVKTLDLLTMDMNKSSKEEKQSEKAMEKGALENKTALYGELHCRGSIEYEVDIFAVLFEPPGGKTNNVVSEQVRHKLGCTCTATEVG